MFANSKVLVAKGVINLFETKDGNHVLLFVTTNKKYCIPLLKDKSSYIALFNEVDMDDFAHMSDLILNLGKVYPFMAKRKYLTSPKARALVDDALVIQKYITHEGKKAPDDILHEMLEARGYDISNILHSSSSYGSRDYTLLREQPDAKDAFERIGEKVKFTTVDETLFAPDVKLVYDAVKAGHCSTVFLVGPAGTGKTIQTYLMSQAMGAPLLTYQATDGMVIEDMKGQFIPSTTSGKSWEYCMGLLLKAYTEGWQFTIDEINMAPPSILSLLNQYTDDTPCIFVNDKVYNKHKNFVLYLTMNAGYEGTYSLNPALKSRGMKLQINKLTAVELGKRLESYANKKGLSFPTSFWNLVYDYQEFISRIAKEYGEIAEICIRQGQQLVDLILDKADYNQFVEAIHIAYTNNLAMDQDNTAKIETLKATPELQDKIKKLYDEYPYRSIPTVVESDLSDYESLIETEFETEEAPTNSADISMSLSEDELESLSAILGENDASFKKSMKAILEDEDTNK